MKFTKKSPINRHKAILYIHGYLSGANGSTANKLREKYKGIYEVITPEVTCNPVESLEIINKAIEEYKPMVIIGSSMGGFYALACESRDIPLILINPLLVFDEEQQSPFLCKELPYHCKRNDGRTSSIFTTDDFNAFRSFDVNGMIEDKGKNIYAVLSSRDEVLGDTHIKALSNHAHRMSVFSDFGHRCGGSCLSAVGGIVESVYDAGKMC